MTFNFRGSNTTVTNYFLSNDRYIFEFKDVAPRMMNDIITATLWAVYEGEEVQCHTVTYSVKQYCDNMLARCEEGGIYANDEKFKRLLIDLLNYGSAAQIYADYNTDTLANASLTETQKSWATQGSLNLESVTNTKYEEIENASATWKSAGLVLQDAVIMRIKIATESVEGLTVKIRTDENQSGWTVSEFVETSGGYYLYFDGLSARKMSETVYVTAYRNGEVISNTLTYSIESYAKSKQNDTNESLANLVEAMMKYGKSAKAYKG